MSLSSSANQEAFYSVWVKNNSLMSVSTHPGQGVSAKQGACAQERAELQVRSLWAALEREAFFCFQVIRRDLSATVVPGLLFSLAAWYHSGAVVAELPAAIGSSLLYFTLFTYTFCLSNQIVGVEEDRLNKPDRPLARGVLSLEAAWLRWGVSMALFTATGAHLGVLGWTLVWQLATFIHNPAGGSKNWLVKNLVNGVGVVVMLQVAWQQAAPMMVSAQSWLLFLALAVATLVAIQDLRDLEGDRASGRRTLPLVIGVKATRRVLAVGFALLALATHVLLMELSSPSAAVLVCDAVLGLVSLTIAARVLLLRTARADHHSYLLFTGWYCLALASSFVVL